MNTYICKCGRRVQKSGKADNTGYRIKNYRPGFECYGCPYVMPCGCHKWDETTKHFIKDVKGYECRMSPTLSYASRFIGSTADKCTCAVISLDFDFLEQVSSWVKETFTLGELTGHFSRDEIRATDYSHDGRYHYGLCCAGNKKGIAAKAALFARFFNPDGSRKDMTPQQEMEKILADIKKAKENPTCATVPNADAAATTAESAAPNAAAETLTTSESAADASESIPAASLQNCESDPVSPVESSPAVRPAPSMTATEAAIFDYSQFDDQTAQALQNFAFRALQVARTYYRDLMEIVVGAHKLLCGPLVPDGDNSRYGNRGEDTFRAWCASVHINKTKAYQLLQIQSFMDTCTPEEQSTLALLPFTAMRELVTGDTPEQVITMAKEGKVGTSKEVLELKAQLKAEKERADAAEAREVKARQAAHTYHVQLEETTASRNSLLDQQGAYIADINALTERADKAEARAKDAENDYNAALSDVNALSAANRRKTEELEALKRQPITAVVDKDEVQRQANELYRQRNEEEIDRLAAEKAWGLADARNAELQADKDKLAKDNAALRKELAALRSKTNDDAQADFETANYCASLFRAAWDNSKASYSRLTGEDLETTFQALCGTLNSIMEEAALLCRQPPDYDGGADDEPDV